MHRIMIHLCMIDQMIAGAETKGRAVPQQRQESSGNACRARNIVIWWVYDCPCSQDNTLGAFHVVKLEI